jgi:predicted RNA-binding Zn-ribbon protein involved in translation (DUF1610 family)
LLNLFLEVGSPVVFLINVIWSCFDHFDIPEKFESFGYMFLSRGLIKEASKSKPKAVSAVFECIGCGDLHEKEQESSELGSPYKCACGNRKFDVKDKKYGDPQEMLLTDGENRGYFETRSGKTGK